MNDKTNGTTIDTKSGKSSGEDAAEKKTSPLLLVGIGAGALVAGLLAYLVTTKLVDGGASPCEAAKAEILEIKALAPDAAVLNTRPDLSLRLSNAGRELQSTCIYIDGREFEMANVDPWLGTPPAGAPAPTIPAPAGGIAPATTLAPTPSAVPSIAPETTTAGG